VGEILNGYEQVEFCNVYGVEVPHTDGRAGMVALRLKEGVAELDREAFATYVSRELPAYARPVFVRVQQDIDVTGTFKMVKGDLKKEAYDIEAISDPVLVLKPGATAYEPLEASFVDAIRSGDAGF